MIDWTGVRFEKLPCGIVVLLLPDESIWLPEFLSDLELKDLAEECKKSDLGEVPDCVKKELQKRGLLCVVV